MPYIGTDMVEFVVKYAFENGISFGDRTLERALNDAWQWCDTDIYLVDGDHLNGHIRECLGYYIWRDLDGYFCVIDNVYAKAISSHLSDYLSLVG